MRPMHYFCLLLIISLSNAQVCEWDPPEKDRYLADFACGDEVVYPTLAAAQDKCCTCGAGCSGVVENPDGYTIREDSALLYSPYDETSYRIDKSDALFTCYFGPAVKDVYLGGYAAGDQTDYQTVKDAKAACCDNPSCKGVTCSSDWVCTVRANTNQIQSQSGERSYPMIASPVSCLTLGRDIIKTVSAPESLISGSSELIIAPDLESFDITVTWADATSTMVGLQIHDPDLYLVSVYLCNGQQTSPCVQTIERGDQAANADWDDVINGLRTEEGYFIAMHTKNHMETEGVIYFRCEGFNTPDVVPPCTPATMCPVEFFMCFNEPKCVAWMNLYSHDICHYDKGRDAAKSTPPGDCWTMHSFDLQSPDFQVALAFFDCIICCGPCP